MRQMKNLFLTILTSLFLISCDNSNPMMNQWSDKNAEFGGVPAFDKMTPELELILEKIKKLAET